MISQKNLSDITKNKLPLAILPKAGNNKRKQRKRGRLHRKPNGYSSKT